MKLNRLLLVLASGLGAVGMTACGGSNGNSSAPVLTPQATQVSVPSGSTISSGSTVAVGCAESVCTLQIPGGSGFESVTAPEGINSADQISAVTYQNGNVVLIDTSNVVYTGNASSSVSQNSNNLGAVPFTYFSVLAPESSILASVSLNSGSYIVSIGLPVSSSIIASATAGVSTVDAVAAPTPSQCSGASGVTTTAISGTSANVAGSPYTGIGLSNGQVCVYNTSSQTFTNLTTDYTKASTAYSSETNAVGGIAFYQSGSSCSGYWFNQTDGNIWGVNATCGSSTVTANSFNQLNSSSVVSGLIPQNASAIYVDATNGVYVGGTLAGQTAIFYLSPGTSVWTATTLGSGTVTAISSVSNPTNPTEVSVSLSNGLSYNVVAGQQ